MKIFQALTLASIAAMATAQSTCKKENEKCNAGVAPQYGCCEGFVCQIPSNSPPGAAGNCVKPRGQQDSCKKEGEHCNAGVAPQYGCCEDLVCRTRPGSLPGGAGKCVQKCDTDGE